MCRISHTMPSRKLSSDEADLVMTKSLESSFTSSHGNGMNSTNPNSNRSDYTGIHGHHSGGLRGSESESKQPHQNGGHVYDDDETKPLIEGDLKNEITDCFPARYVLCWMAYWGFVLVYCLRVTVSIGVAAMVNSSYTMSRDPNATGEYCEERGANGTRQDEDLGEFDWDSETQELILAGFFYGYVFSQLPGGWMADKIGGKYLFACGVLCTSVCSLLFPVTSYAGFGYVFSTRVISGLGEGITFPAMFAMFSNWVHPEERSRLAVFTFSGSCLGNILGQALSGVTAASGFIGGWPAPFYIFGGIGLIWFVAWLYLAYNTPAEHPRISVAERKYIESGTSRKTKVSNVKVPWVKILTCVPVWAQVLAHMTACWGYFTLLTNLPIYMNDVLRYDLTMSGILSAVPYAAQWAAMLLCGLLSDYLINTQFLSRTAIRKLFVVTGLFTYGVSQALLAVVGCNGALAVTLISVGLCLVGGAFAGYLPNTLDLAPAYSGSIGGLVQSSGPISGILGPYVVGVFTEDQSDLLGWKIVFYISFGVTAFGALFYLIFASGVEQPWGAAAGSSNSDDGQKYDRI